MKRILIVTPANLSFQWQRELKDKFQEKFEVVRSDVLRANYGSNPWQEKNQVVTSISWVSRIEDAKPIMMAAESETAEIIRRRLFEWQGLNDDAKRTITEYSDWIIEHRQQTRTPRRPETSSGR